MVNPTSFARQKRRLRIYTVLIIVAAVLRLGLTFDAAFLASLGLGMGLSALRFIPSIRQCLESLGVGLVIAAPFPVPADLFFALVLVLSTGVYHFLHGSWSARTGLRFGLASERTASAALPIDAVWQRIVPGCGHPDDFWSSNLVDFDADPDDPLTVYLRYRDDRDLFSEVTITFLERDAPTNCRYMIEPENELTGDETTFSIALESAGKFGTTIESRIEIVNLTPRAAAACWFDDSLGDEWDGLATTSRRAQRWVASWPWLANKMTRRRAPVDADDFHLAAAQEHEVPDLDTQPAARVRATQAEERAPKTTAADRDEAFEEAFEIMKLVEDPA